jgi:hypothetical protein
VSAFVRAAASIMALAAAAVVVCAGPGCAPPIWDLRVLEWFAAKRGPTLDVFFAAITWLGSLWLLLPLALALVGGLALNGHGAKAMRFAAAFGGAVVLGYVTKFARLWPRLFG